MTDILSSILEKHRRRALSDKRSFADLREEAKSFLQTKENKADFAQALRSPKISVIAEIKRKSPSKGVFLKGGKIEDLIKIYAENGAAALSVLTDSDHFDGSAQDLKTARKLSELPILRKDFTVSENDICDAVLMGADAVLLIVSALEDAELAKFIELSQEMQIDAVVEVFDHAEIERALNVGADIIQVNQRNLRSFEENPEQAAEMASSMPKEVLKIAASAIKTREQVEKCEEEGYEAVLVGEHLLRSEDPAAALRVLAGEVK